MYLIRKKKDKNHKGHRLNNMLIYYLFVQLGSDELFDTCNFFSNCMLAGFILKKN